MLSSSDGLDSTGASVDRRSVKRKLADTLPEPSSPEVTEHTLAGDADPESTAAQVRPSSRASSCRVTRAEADRLAGRLGYACSCAMPPPRCPCLLCVARHHMVVGGFASVYTLRCAYSSAARSL